MVAALPLYFTSKYKLWCIIYHAITMFIILVFVHGVQLTVLHHFTVSEVLLISLFNCYHIHCYHSLSLHSSHQFLSP